MLLRLIALAGLVTGSTVPMAVADEELPDMEFLEYLGSWEQDDAEWLIFDLSDETENVDESADAESGEEQPTARAQDSTERQDEG